LKKRFQWIGGNNLLRIAIPERGEYAIRHLVFDYNGTLAVNGQMEEAVLSRMADLAGSFHVSVITADTYGTVAEALRGTGIDVKIISKARGTLDKRDYVESLGASEVIAFGNGSNDALMLETAAIGVVVMNPEGVSLEAMLKGDLLVNSIHEAMDLVVKPDRLVADLRR